MKMYKTIRHGENSLQYTILPQNDDFRIEGKLSSASGGGGGGVGGGSSNGNSSAGSNGGRKCKGRRPKRRSFFAYLGLIFVCTVIVGAVLIPFLVSAECLPSPTEWFLKTKAALTKASSNNNNNANANADTAESPSSAASASAAAQHAGIGSKHGIFTQSLTGNGVNVGKTVKIINTNGVEKIILKLNKTSTETPTVASTANAITSNINNAGEETVTQATRLLNADENNNNNNNNNNNAEALEQPLQQQQQQQSEHFVTEVRFPGTSVLSASAATIVVTTLRSTNDNYNTNTNNNNNMNQNIITTNTNNAQQQSTTVKINNNAQIDTPQTRPTATYSYTANVNSPRAPANANANGNVGNNNNNNTDTTPTIITRIMQVPLLKATAKKPNIPPVLVKTNSQSIINSNYNNHHNNNNNDDDEIPTINDADNMKITTTEQKSENGHQQYHKMKESEWIRGHWPYIDPSTYFQWSGYKAEDSVLLPALLGFALIGVILIIAVCLVARNKRTIVSTVRKRNRNDIEENGAEDNATLLTTTNLSDED